MADVVGAQQFRAVRVFVQGDFEYKTEVADVVRESEFYDELKHPSINVKSIETVCNEQEFRNYLSPRYSSVQINPDAIASDEVYHVNLTAKI